MHTSTSKAMWLALTFAIIGIAALILFPKVRTVFNESDSNKPAPPEITAYVVEQIYDEDRFLG